MKPLLAVLLSLVVSLAMWMVYREGIKAGRDEVTVEWQAGRTLPGLTKRRQAEFETCMGSAT